MRRTARALAIRTLALIAALLLPVVSQAAVLSAAPAVTRSRAGKPRPPFAQPVAASAGRGTSTVVARARRGTGKTQAVASRERSRMAEPKSANSKSKSKSSGKLLRAVSRSTHPAPAARGRSHSRQAGARDAVAMRRASPTRSGPAANSREMASRKIPVSVAPAGAAIAGGELTMDQFTQVADAAAGGAPVATAAKPHGGASTQRVDGFGAEGLVPSQPAVSTQPSDSVPDTALATAAAGDPRVRALVHPSHEEMAEELAEPVVLPGLYRNGRLMVPAPMKGSHDILVHQNAMANDEGLERVRNEEELQRLRASRQLVDFPETAGLRVNPELGADRRCARAWTVKFAQDTGHAFYARFHEPLQVNSAVRTVAYQVRLQRTNGNAAGIGGETASPHLTGQAIDFGKRGMSVEQIAWMRAYLKPMMDAGKVDVEEEFQQACFHISVYKSYLPAMPGVRRVQVAAVVRPAVTDR